MKKSNVVAVCVFCVLSVTAGYLWQNQAVKTPSKNWEFKKAVRMKNVHPHARSIASEPELHSLFRDMAVGYVMGHVLINQFDECLASAGPGNSAATGDCGQVKTDGAAESEYGMTNTNVYSKILAHRGIMEDLEHTIESVYVSNVEAVVEQIKNAPAAATSSESNESVADEQPAPDEPIAVNIHGRQERTANVNTNESVLSSREAGFLTALGEFMDVTAQMRETITGISEPIPTQAYLFGVSRLKHKQAELLVHVEKIKADLSEEIEHAEVAGEAPQMRRALGFVESLIKRINERDQKFSELLLSFNAEEAERVLASFPLPTVEALHDRITAASEQINTFRSERSPDSATGNCPSVSSNGNITGNTFPANTWSMTYDDGPNNSTSLQILRNLQASGVKASFYMLAKQVDAFPSAARQIKDAEMEIALHSYNHRDIGVTVTRKLNGQATPAAPESLEEFLETEIVTSKSTIERALGVEIKNFRLPYGSGMSRALRRNREGEVIGELVSRAGATQIRTKLAEEKMMHIFWNVDSLDWQDTNADSVTRRVMGQVAQRSKGVILYHDIHPQSVTSSNAVITQMLAQNKIFKTTEEILAAQNAENGITCP